MGIPPFCRKRRVIALLQLATCRFVHHVRGCLRRLTDQGGGYCTRLSAERERENEGFLCRQRSRFMLQPCAHCIVFHRSLACLWSLLALPKQTFTHRSEVEYEIIGSKQPDNAASVSHLLRSDQIRYSPV